MLEKKQQNLKRAMSITKIITNVQQQKTKITIDRLFFLHTKPQNLAPQNCVFSEIMNHAFAVDSFYDSLSAKRDKFFIETFGGTSMASQKMAI